MVHMTNIIGFISSFINVTTINLCWMVDQRVLSLPCRRYCDILINEYELRVMLFTSCVYCTRYELIFAYELRVIAWLLLHDLRVAFCVAAYIRSYDLHFLCEFRVLLIARVTFQLWVVIKIKMIKMIKLHGNEVMIKNYFFRSLFGVNLAVWSA